MNNNKIVISLLGAILLIGISGLIVSLQPKVQPEINVAPPEVNVSSPEVNVPAPEVSVFPKVSVLGGIESLTRAGTGGVATTVSISATTTAGSNVLAFATSSEAKYRRLQNIGNVNITCAFTTATTSMRLGKGILLYSSSSVNSIYEMSAGVNLWWGPVNCLSETSTGTLGTQQY